MDNVPEAVGFIVTFESIPDVDLPFACFSCFSRRHTTMRIISKTTTRSNNPSDGPITTTKGVSRLASESAAKTERKSWLKLVAFSIKQQIKTWQRQRMFPLYHLVCFVNLRKATRDHWAKARVHQHCSVLMTTFRHGFPQPLPSRTAWSLWQPAPKRRRWSSVRMNVIISSTIFMSHEKHLRLQVVLPKVLPTNSRVSVSLWINKFKPNIMHRPRIVDVPKGFSSLSYNKKINSTLYKTDASTLCLVREDWCCIFGKREKKARHLCTQHVVLRRLRCSMSLEKIQINEIGMFWCKERY